MISVKGTFHNGVAEPAEPVEGRDGDPVLITFTAGATALPESADKEKRRQGLRALTQVIKECAMDTGINDLAHQHDHYLHGTPKREGG